MGGPHVGDIFVVVQQTASHVAKGARHHARRGVQREKVSTKSHTKWRHLAIFLLFLASSKTVETALGASRSTLHDWHLLATRQNRASSEALYRS